MSRLIPLLLCSLTLLLGCGGDDHDHKDHDHHDHKDHAHDHHDHKDHDHKDHKDHKDHGHDHDHSGPNAHLWLDPVLTRKFIERVGSPLNEIIVTTTKPGRKPLLVVSIHPLASLISEIVGDEAEVFTMLPQGGSPHGFEMTPDVMKKLGAADGLVMIGMSLDPWAEKAAKNTGKKELKIVKFADLTGTEKPGEAKPLPSDSAMAARLAAVVVKIDALDAKYKTALAAVKMKEMVTFHNAFDLLAARYGLKVVAHLTEMDLPTGAEVTPGHLMEARDAVVKFKLKTLYAEPAYPDTALMAIAEATKVKVLRLDDLGGPDREGYRTYFEMMESNLKVLIEGQSRE